jgi:hypothetical protein
MISISLVVLRALLQVSAELVVVAVLVLTVRYSWRIAVRFRRPSTPRETKLEIGAVAQASSSRPTVVEKDSPPPSDANAEPASPLVSRRDRP